MKVLIVDTSFRYQPTLYDITIAQYGVITVLVTILDSFTIELSLGLAEN